jgi:hypothetical protein
MTVYRMAFRFGSQGRSWWEECRRAGVAAIGYGPMMDIDLSSVDLCDLDGLDSAMKERWDELDAAPKGSLRKVVCHMKAGDIIYVKEGTQIVGRGKVSGPYQFCPDTPIAYYREYDGFRWQHQVPVDWDPAFKAIDILLGSELTTVLRLNENRIAKLNGAIRSSGQDVW